MTTIEQIDDYVSGTMEETDADAFEVDLFDAAAHGDGDLTRLAADWSSIAFGVRTLAARGTLEPFVTRAEVERLRASGLRVQVLDFGDGGLVFGTLYRSTDVLVTRFGLDLSGVDRLEVERGIEGLGFVTTEVAFDPHDGAAYACCEGALAASRGDQMPPGVPTIVRFFAHRGAARELLAEWQCTGEVVDEPA
jgi:hypothetical protein